MRKEIRHLKDQLKIRNASGKTVSIFWIIALMFQIRISSKRVNFVVTNKLVTSVILSCDFCDRLFETKKPILAIAEMDE